MFKFIDQEVSMGHCVKFFGKKLFSTCEEQTYHWCHGEQVPGDALEGLCYVKLLPCTNEQTEAMWQRHCVSG